MQQLAAQLVIKPKICYQPVAGELDINIYVRAIVQAAPAQLVAALIGQ